MMTATPKQKQIFAGVIALVLVALVIVFVLSRNRNAPVATTTTSTTSSKTNAPIPAPAPASAATPVPTAPLATPLDLDSVLADFNDKYSYPVLGVSICPDIVSGEYVQDLNDLEAAADGYLPGYESIIEYFSYLESVCNDGKLNQTEFDQVQILFEKVGNREGNLMRWQTHFAFVDEMRTYLLDTLGDDHTFNCDQLASLTVEQFMQHISTLTSSYRTPARGGDLREEFLSRQETCLSQN